MSCHGERDPAEDLTAELIDLAVTYGDPGLAARESQSIVEKLARRTARRLIRSGPVDPAMLPAAALIIADEAIEVWKRHEARRLLEERRESGGHDRLVIEELVDVLGSYGADLALDEPSTWVDLWYQAEAERRRSPDGIRNDNLRDQMRRLNNLIYHDARVLGFLGRLIADGVEIGDVQQVASTKIFRRFLKADRLDARGDLVQPTKERAYVTTALRRAFLDLAGRHRERPVDTLDELPFDGPGAGLSATERATERLDLLALFGQIVDRSFAAPGLLGVAYDVQWRGVSNANARRSLARRFAIASLFTAWQRRSPVPVASDLIEGLEQSVPDDDGSWLRALVHRALGLLLPTWGRHYGERLPRDRSTEPGHDDGTEAADYAFLVRECRGQTDNRRPPDPHGNRSARAHGVGALVHLLYGDLVGADDEGDR